MNPALTRSASMDAEGEASVGVRVRELEAVDFSRWDEFVSGCREATFFHRAGWKTVIERAFGHRTKFLYAEAEGRIEGVLPLAELRSILFGHALVSLPFCVYGGIAAGSERARRVLDEAAGALAEERRVDHLEYRSFTPHHPEWAHSDLYVTFRKAIDPDVERNLNEIPRKQRAMVRKGIKAGLKSEIDEGVERFFAAYAHSVHRLGTPVLSKRYFQALRDVFGLSCEVLTVTQEGRLVASVMSFYFRDEVLPYYGGGTDLAREVAGHDFIYGGVMGGACGGGGRVVGYGRSKRGTGPFGFQKNLGVGPRTPPHQAQVGSGANACPK